MDLSWCIICDKRIEDDNVLYCSSECELKDQNMFLANNSSTIPKQPPVLKSWMLKKSSTAKHVLSTPSYPWIPLYRKRQHFWQANNSKRCQPTVSGSPIIAHGALLSTH